MCDSVDFSCPEYNIAGFIGCNLSFLSQIFQDLMAQGVSAPTKFCHKASISITIGCFYTFVFWGGLGEFALEVHQAEFSFFRKYLMVLFLSLQYFSGRILPTPFISICQLLGVIKHLKIAAILTMRRTPEATDFVKASAI